MPDPTQSLSDAEVLALLTKEEGEAYAYACLFLRGQLEPIPQLLEFMPAAMRTIATQRRELEALREVARQAQLDANINGVSPKLVAALAALDAPPAVETERDTLTTELALLRALAVAARRWAADQGRLLTRAQVGRKRALCAAVNAVPVVEEGKQG